MLLRSFWRVPCFWWRRTGCFLYQTPIAGTSQASQAFWQVDDIEREVADLTLRGVEFETCDMPGQQSNGIMTAGGAKAAWFKDSKGNIMALIPEHLTCRPDAKRLVAREVAPLVRTPCER